VADFVDDNLDLLTVSDAPGLSHTPTPGYIVAANVNPIADAAKSVRTGLLNGKLHGLRSNPSAPVAAMGEVINSSNDGTPMRSANGRAAKPAWAGDVVTRAASAGAWTPNLHEHAHGELTLDANGILNVPLVDEGAAMVGGVRLELRIAQDGTGGRGLTLDSNIVGGSRFLPRQGPGQVSTLTLKRTVAGTWYLHDFDGIDTTKDFDVTDFGADPTRVADSAQAIQNAVDLSKYGGYGNAVFLPAGCYRISKTIHLGYGDGTVKTYTSIVLRGAGVTHHGEESLKGSVVYADFSNAPAINVQGGRLTCIRDLTVLGRFLPYLVNNNACKRGDWAGESDPLFDDRAAANWHDPSLNANQDSRYAPYAGIAVDGYSGTQPTPSYPAVTYPAIAGTISSQYGKAYSSATEIRNVSIIGFHVGVVTHPSGSDGNGDFLRFHNGAIEYCTYGVSISHTQSRNVDVQNVQGNVLFCMFTNNQHGLQTGKFGGTLTDVSLAQVIQAFQFGSGAFYGPLVVNSMYGESMFRIGDITPGTSTETAIIVNGGQFSLGLQDSLTRGVPATCLGGYNQETSVLFNGTIFSDMPSVCVLNVKGIRLDECRMVALSRASVSASAYIAHAHNALAGGFVVPYLSSRNLGALLCTAYRLDTNAPYTNVHLYPENTYGRRLTCASIYCRKYQPDATWNTDQAVNHPMLAAYAMLKSDAGTFSALSVSGRTLTLTFTSLSDSDANVRGAMPGDVILDEDTGITFFIRSRSATTVLAEAQNGYIKVSGTNTVQGFSTTTGYMYFLNSRFYTPAAPVMGDITAASAVATTMGCEDGNTAGMSSVVVGDAVYFDPQIDYAIPHSQATVTAVNTGARTMTFTGAFLKTGHRRFPWFIKQAPANA
jgi:hypothetical protein